MDPETVLFEATVAYQSALGPRLLATYALGSLAHGGFSPLVSDVDLAVIVADPVLPGDANDIEAIADAQKSRGTELSKRLSVFWGTPATLRGEALGGRFPPLDRLDLIESGRLLTGEDVRAGLPSPNKDELLTTGAEFALEFLAGIDSSRRESLSPGLGSLRPAGDETIKELRHPELLVARGVRRLTKLVLFPVRFMFTAATGRVGTNEAAVTHYLGSETSLAKKLVAAALGWRDAAPADDDVAADLLSKYLLPLYAEYIDDHISRLARLGERDLVRSFEEWGRRLAFVN
jgi:predicted nucleotidyltransferase